MSRLEELIAAAQAGDKAASEQLVTENAGLIWSVAKRFLGRRAGPRICINWDVWGF